MSGSRNVDAWWRIKNDTQLVDKLSKNEHHSSTMPLKREANEDESYSTYSVASHASAI